jgi:hypothetical protein
MCILIIIIFILIGSVAFFGDYNEKELKEDYKKYEEIVNANRDTTKVTKSK